MKKKIGDFEVSDNGIERVAKLEDFGGYTTELIMPKKIFVEAYTKYIRALEDDYYQMPKLKPLFCDSCGIAEMYPRFKQRYCRYCGAKFELKIGEQSPPSTK